MARVVFSRKGQRENLYPKPSTGRVLAVSLRRQRRAAATQTHTP